MDTSTQESEATIAVDTLGRRVAPRRHRTIEEKLAIVAESLKRGASVAEVARRYQVNANQVFAWRRLHKQGLLELRSRRMTGRRLVPIKLLEANAVACAAPASTPWPPVSISSGLLNIELPGGIRVAVSGSIDPAWVTQALSVLLR